MKVAVYCRELTSSHMAVAQAVVAGAQALGDDAWVFSSLRDGAFRFPTKDARTLLNKHGLEAFKQDADVVVIFSIGGDAKMIWDANAHARRIFLDKPYVRGGVPAINRYHTVRVSIDAFQPLKYFQQIAHKSDRWLALKRPMPLAYRQQYGSILFDGASNKYCEWHELGGWHAWGQAVIQQIRQHTDLPIIYRPRPDNNRQFVPQNATLSTAPLLEDFMRARVVVSHGGNIGFDATVMGIPHFAIADSIARPLSETDWARVGLPRIPMNGKRGQWLFDLAYCQWTLDEFADGSAWRYVRETMELIDHLNTKLKVAHAR